MKQKYPHLLRVQNQSKPEVEVNLKENLKVTDKTHQKTKRQMNHILMITLIIITIMIITLPQVKVKAADLLMVKAVANNSEASHSEAEARDLSIIRINFRTTGFREVHTRVTAIMVGPITTIITITSISITLMINRPNSTSHPVAYVEVFIIPLSIATKENTI